MSTPPPQSGNGAGAIVQVANSLFFILGAIACVPLFGAFIWPIAGLALFVTFILSIVVMCHGSKKGIELFFMTVLIMPLFVAIAPFASAAVLGLATGIPHATTAPPNPIATKLFAATGQAPAPVVTSTPIAPSAAPSDAHNSKTTWTYDPTLKRYVNHDASVSSQQSYGGGGNFYIPRSSPTPNAIDSQRGWQSSSPLNQRAR